MKNWRQTIIAEFSNGPKLVTLLESINAWIDPSTNFENFFNLLWNIDTAVGYGLDVWGRILVIPRQIKVPQTTFFGFQEAGDRTGFNQGPFWTGIMAGEAAYTLTDSVYRLLLFAKAAFNITNCSIPAINAIMMNLFPNRGNCYVTDNTSGPVNAWFGFQEAGDRTGFNQAPFGDLFFFTNSMVMQYVFRFPLQPYEKAIVESGVLPRPAGVSASWLYLAG